jgi:hypothetical protein
MNDELYEVLDIEKNILYVGPKDDAFRYWRIVQRAVTFQPRKEEIPVPEGYDEYDQS